jgi:ROK family protein
MISDMFRKTRIELAQQGNQAGLLGALYNFLNKNK